LELRTTPEVVVITTVVIFVSSAFAVIAVIVVIVVVVKVKRTARSDERGCDELRPGNTPPGHGCPLRHPRLKSAQ
jgi:hypothetical protein